MYREPIEIPGHEIYPNIFRGKELLPRNNRLQIGILTGPSGAGKDRILTEMVESGYFKQLVTATTRRRRYKVLDLEPDLTEQMITHTSSSEEYLDLLDYLEYKGKIETTEPKDAYVWMRWQKRDESTEKYHQNLIEEYGLVEHDFHFGNFYGLPKSSVIICQDLNCLPVIRTDFTGTQSLNRTIPQSEFRLINFAIIPDNWEQVEKSIIEREQNISERELQERLQRNIEEQKFYPETIHFYIKNTREEIDCCPGIKTTVKSLSYLTEDLLREQ